MHFIFLLFINSFPFSRYNLGIVVDDKSFWAAKNNSLISDINLNLCCLFPGGFIG